MSPKNPVVSVLISDFNDEELLRKNLVKIVELSKNPKNSILEIIVVDDGSTDGSSNYIKENFPKIRLIKHKVNRGIASAFNTGVRSARGSLILMISPDMIPTKNLVVSLLPHFENQKVFAVSFHEKGVGPEKGVWKDGFVQFKNEKELREPENTFYVRKGEGIFNRKIWVELGGMDEKLFTPFYWEDLDISYRALKRGYQNLWEPKAEITHQHWGTLGRLNRNFVEKKGELHMLLFIWKNINSRNLIRKHITGLFSKIAKNPGYLKIVLMALGKLPTVLREKRREAHESKISDETIFSRFSS